VSPGAARGWITVCVFGLVVMATWTLVIKFLAPILFLVAERAAGRPLAAAPILWDFWWAAHLGLAWLLWRRHPRALPVALTVALLEAVIVLVKFVAYFRQPDLSFWRLLWLTNKIYVLAFFLLFLALLARREIRSALGEGHGRENGRER